MSTLFVESCRTRILPRSFRFPLSVRDSMMIENIVYRAVTRRTETCLVPGRQLTIIARIRHEISAIDRCGRDVKTYIYIM